MFIHHHFRAVQLNEYCIGVSSFQRKQKESIMVHQQAQVSDIFAAYSDISTGSRAWERQSPFQIKKFPTLAGWLAGWHRPLALVQPGPASAISHVHLLLLRASSAPGRAKVLRLVSVRLFPLPTRPSPLFTPKLETTPLRSRANADPDGMSKLRPLSSRWWGRWTAAPS